MYRLIKKILFLFPPERAHHIAMGGLKIFRAFPFGEKILKACFCYKDPSLKKEVFGITFPNPVGLAAGFDKDAKWMNSLECLGFGFMEIGTVTPLPQLGNEKPRLFRLREDQALINRMGFNNEGAEAAARRISKSRPRLIIGGNIGKNKITPNEDATGDYEKCFHALYDVVDYFVINVSSPNTPGLRSLQEKEPLKRLILHLQDLNKQKPVLKPILLKIAPDLHRDQLNDIVSIVLETGLSGIVATNTTVSREGIHASEAKINAIGSGGLSGKPLQQRSTEIVRYLRQRTKGLVPIIASGGVFNAADAKEKLEAGASLVQVYTGFIYEGPRIAKKICRGLVEMSRNT